jgi:hypothetical protein
VSQEGRGVKPSLIFSEGENWDIVAFLDKRALCGIFLHRGGSEIEESRQRYVLSSKSLFLFYAS